MAMNRLVDREMQDHPIEQTYMQWARQYLNDPSKFGPQHMKGLDTIFRDPSNTLSMLLEDPNVTGLLGQQQDAQRAQQAAMDAYRKAIGAQRAAAAKQRAIQRKRLDFQLDTGLRDIEQGREKGLQGAINNALQRGIFKSGILTENKEEVNRESDEAASDLRTQIDLALQSLAAQAAAQKASYGAQDAQTAAQQAAQQAAGALTIEDLAAVAQNFWSSPMDLDKTFGPTSEAPPPPSVPSAPGVFGDPSFKVPYAPEATAPPGPLYPSIPKPKNTSPIQPVGGGRY